jgi:hypothetical protein
MSRQYPVLAAPGRRSTYYPHAHIEHWLPVPSNPLGQYNYKMGGFMARLRWGPGVICNVSRASVILDQRTIREATHPASTRLRNVSGDMLLDIIRDGAVQSAL